MLHEFYCTTNWQNWGLDDLDEDAEPHATLQDATWAAPDLALELLSLRLGLDWDFLRKHMEYMDAQRLHEVDKAQATPITDPVHGLTVSRKRSRAELVMDEGEAPRCAGVRAVRLCPPKKRAIIERFSGYSAALEGGAVATG